MEWGDTTGPLYVSLALTAVFLLAFVFIRNKDVKKIFLTAIAMSCVAVFGSASSVFYDKIITPDVLSAQLEEESILDEFVKESVIESWVIEGTDYAVKVDGKVCEAQVDVESKTLKVDEDSCFVSP